MTECNHHKLTLVGNSGKKLRCRHCHLTIDEKELGEDCCPECLDTSGARRRDFEEIQTEDAGTVRYRCETCGILIEVD